MGTSQSTPTDESVPNEPNQGFEQGCFDYPRLNMPTYQKPIGPNQGFTEDLFYYPPPSTSNQGFEQGSFDYPPLNTPIGSNQGFTQDLFYYPPPSTSNQGFDQGSFDYPPLNTLIGPNQGFTQDLFYYPSPSTSTDRTPNGPNRDFVQDLFSYPSLSTPTYHTPNRPVQDYLQGPFDYPPLNTPTYATPNGPVQGDYLQDRFTNNYPPLRTPTNQTSEPKRKCDSCRRIEYIMQLTNLGDGRYLCPDCFSISLVQPSQLEHLIHQVHSFFHHYLELPVKKNIPIFFVDANGMGEHARSSHNQGLTLFDDKATIKIVERCVRRGADMEVVTKEKEVKRDKVVAILLLFGFPKPILGATLAHEMGHALIRLQDWTFILERKRKLEEGICEAIAYEWLKHTITNCDPSYTQKEAEIAAYNQKGAEIAGRVRREEMSRIERGEHAAEFREAHRAIKKYGLKRTLKRVGRSRSIPE